MTGKSAKQKIKDLDTFLSNSKRAIDQLTELKRRLETDEGFRQLWESDSAAALKAVGIDPEARQEMGYPPYSKGPECINCITPNGNACHC